MRTIVFIIIIICGIISTGHAQSNVITSDSVIKELDMNPIMFKEWYSIDSNWTANMFPSCLSENHLKLSCASCEKVFLVVQMKIDSTGKLTRYTKITENMCGSVFTPLLEKCFLDFFYFLEFPVLFRNKTIEVRLGNGLKC